MLAAASIVTAESLLALTPVAIKQIPLDAVSAVWSRVLTSGTLGFFLADSWDVGSGEWTGAGALGALNLAHIASSYESFRHLPAGQAMSLLYTYPMWNLILGALCRGEAISGRTYGLMGAATAGSLLINLDPGRPSPPASLPHSVKPDRLWGIGMGLTMALTESGIFTITKMLQWSDAAKSVWVLNFSALLWLLLVTSLGLVKSPEFIAHGGTNDPAWWGLTLFHTVALFGGYWLRFYAIPRLSTVTYSVLSFSGLLAAYLFGLIFVGERPGWVSVVGAVILVASAVMIEVGEDGGR